LNAVTSRPQALGRAALRARSLLAATAALLAAGAAVLAACTSSEQSGRSAAGTGCDRTCLEGFVDSYLDALVAGDASRLPLADDVVFVENNQRLELGQGTWRTITGLGNYRHYFADVAAGQAGLIGVVEENGTKIIYDLRLAIADGEIKEIEALAIRDPNGAMLYEERGAPHPKFLETVPVEERLPREQLIAVANSYLSGMQNNDPDGDYSFFHDECDRWEHARQTTNQDPAAYGHSTDRVFVTLTCREQFETGFLGFVTRIRDRRYVVVDEERQTVLGFATLDHNGTIRAIPLARGETFVVPPYFSSPRTLQVGEAWRVEDGKLRQIEMTLTELPYGARPAFPTGDDWLALPTGSAPKPRAPVQCNRRCFESFADVLATALVRHDARLLPGADTLRYTENGQQLAVGDGLWGTVTAFGDRVVAVDPVAQTAVLVAATVETDVPGLLFARFALDGDQVDELEAVIVRHEFTGERGGTLTLFAPRLKQRFDLAAVALTDPALQLDPPVGAVTEPEVVAAAVAANGAEIEAPGVSARARRTWVIDSERGLVIDFALLDVTNEEGVSPEDRAAAPAESTGPYSLMTTTLYKAAGSTARVAANATLALPYGSKVSVFQ
jgi:hypothetical protein